MSLDASPEWLNHAEAWRAWRAAMAGQRMHHGWLLAGKSGLGKLDFAMAAARELVAQPGITESPADHPDIVMVSYGPKDDKEERKRQNGKPFELSKVIRVREIRAMQRRLITRPTLGDRRVIIIQPADDMNVEAANALLKSLEEPPEGTFFILVTHRPSRLLPTIRSRCRMLRFPVLSGGQLERMLEAAGAGGGEGDDARRAAIRAAEGSYGAAIRFAQQDLGPLAGVIEAMISEVQTDPGAAASLAKLIGPRADRARLDAVFELAQALVADHARRVTDPAHRNALVEAHGALVTLAAQAPTYNFDTSLLTVEIGGLLMRASPASEHAHG